MQKCAACISAGLAYARRSFPIGGIATTVVAMSSPVLVVVMAASALMVRVILAREAQRLVKSGRGAA